MSQLILAVPSKGRLEENATDIFARAGMPLKRAGARGYQGHVTGIDTIDVLYLSASEIAARLADGSIHFGITGEDLLREEIPDLDSAVQLVQKLGFGQADVVVALPDGWVDVTRMADFAEVASEFRAAHGRRLRVATKYTHLTAEFFARHDVVDYVLVQSFGATEGAPASGAAEAIVDITSTGATLAANNLRIPDDGLILKSEASLAAALKANWSAPARNSARMLLARLHAYLGAGKMKQVTFFTGGIGVSARPRLSIAEYEDVGHRFGAQQIASSPQHNMSTGSDTFLVPDKNLTEMIEAWMQIGGYEKAVVTTPDFYFEKRNPLFERLAGAIL